MPPPSESNVAALGKFRDRTVVLNAPGYDDARDLQAPERAAKQKREAEAKAREVTAPFIIYAERGYGSFSAKQICAQLTLRGIKFKAADKVGNYDRAWKEYDAIAANHERLKRSNDALRTPQCSPVPSPSTASKRPRLDLSSPLAAAAAASAAASASYCGARGGGTYDPNSDGSKYARAFSAAAAAASAAARAASVAAAVSPRAAAAAAPPHAAAAAAEPLLLNVAVAAQSAMTGDATATTRKCVCKTCGQTGHRSDNKLFHS